MLLLMVKFFSKPSNTGEGVVIHTNVFYSSTETHGHRMLPVQINTYYIH